MVLLTVAVFLLTFLTCFFQRMRLRPLDRIGWWLSFGAALCLMFVILSTTDTSLPWPLWQLTTMFFFGLLYIFVAMSVGGVLGRLTAMATRKMAYQQAVAAKKYGVPYPPMFIDGWYADQYALGERPDFRAPASRLPTTVLESMEVNTAFMASPLKR
jgi:hypothetical protein